MVGLAIGGARHQNHRRSAGTQHGIRPRRHSQASVVIG